MRHEKCLARINRTARSGVVMPKLVTWMNNQRVGELTKLANGAHTFKYAPEWLASRYARPLSLSLPLQRGNITSDAVFNFFDNLLPDSPIVRDRIVKRYHAKSRQPFDLLSEIGRDSVGAVTLLPENETITRPIMAWEKLTEARLEEVLTAYKADIPLGMIREENDFRISVAGAQEKTALLRIGNDWCIPKGITPTTHIIKLPIGEIRQPNATLDLSQSVDNEYYCLLLAKELGLNVPDAEIIKAGRVRALAVERFDRRWNTERTVLLRLPQEDMCQTFGLPSSVKYESDGGPGIARIMAFLMGSSEALRDRYDFMKYTVVSEIWGLVVVNEHDNHDRQRLDSSLVYTDAHNVYYVKSCLSDAKCFSGSRYSFRVQELKPLLFHNWPVHGEIAWLFPAPC
ncbi:HipA domain-containing protein [Escherichia coli]